MKWYSIIVMIFFFITIVSAGPYSSSINQGPYSSNINKVETLFNNNTAFVNSSDNWITNLGVLSDVNTTQHSNNGGFLNIKESWLESLYCKLTGCTMSGDLDMNGNDIIDVGNITADYFSGDGSNLTDLSAAGNDGEIQFNDAGSFGADSALFWNKVNKRLGIGGTPLSPLHVFGSSYNIKIADDNGRQILSSQALKLRSTGAQIQFISGTRTFDFVNPIESKTAQMVVDSIGSMIFKAGFGTNGGIDFRASGTGDIGFQDSSSVDLMYIDTSEGNVGIGTTTPQNNLDVAGAQVIGSSYAGVNTAPTDGLLVEGDIEGDSDLNISGNSTFQGDVEIEGTLTGGSPLRLQDCVQYVNKTNSSDVLYSTYVSSINTECNNVTNIYNNSLIFQNQKFLDGIAFRSQNAQKTSFWLGQHNSGEAVTAAGAFQAVGQDRSEGDSIFNLCDYNFIDCHDGDIGAMDDLEVKDDLYVGGNITGNFIGAEMYSKNNANVTVITAVNTYANVTENVIEEFSNGISISGGKMTIQVPGRYQVVSSISANDGGNKEFHMSVGINGEAQDNCHIPRVIATATDVGAWSLSCSVLVNQNDVVTLMVKNVDDGADVTINDMNFMITRMWGS